VDIFQLSLSVLCLISNRNFVEYFDYLKGEFYSNKALQDLQVAVKNFGFGEEI
jgi:hypothetical protein